MEQRSKGECFKSHGVKSASQGENFPWPFPKVNLLATPSGQEPVRRAGRQSDTRGADGDGVEKAPLHTLLTPSPHMRGCEGEWSSASHARTHAQPLGRDSSILAEEEPIAAWRATRYLPVPYARPPRGCNARAGRVGREGVEGLAAHASTRASKHSPHPWTCQGPAADGEGRDGNHGMGMGMDGWGT